MKNKQILAKILTTPIMLSSCLIPTQFVTSCGYSAKLDLPNKIPLNFGGLYAWQYNNTNGNEPIQIEAFNYKQGECYVNNPNFGQAVLIQQCINYKHKYPEKDVSINMSSFHFGIYAGACIDPNNKNYGKMRRLENCEQDEDGYVRIVFLLVKAAKCGINVRVTGQIPAAYEPTMDEKNNFAEYFYNHMKEKCDDGVTPLSNYLNFKLCDWKGYGDQAASDLLHLKICVVSHYLDFNGVDHNNGATFLSSSNLDSILEDGRNGLDMDQTGAIISNSSKLNKYCKNLFDILFNYLDQEGVKKFQVLVNRTNEQQYKMIKMHQPIDQDKQILMVDDCDDLIELFFTPFGGSLDVWNNELNTYCKYVDLLSTADKDKPIEFCYLTPNFKDNDDFSRTFIKKIAKIFVDHGNKKNNLVLGFNTAGGEDDFKDLKKGKNIHIKDIGRLNTSFGMHEKDMTLSYYKNGEQHFVTILSTANFHTGARYLQSNSFLVIKETTKTNNSMYRVFRNFLTRGMFK